MANFANYGNLESILTTYANKINGKVDKSLTEGLLKNDGTVDTNTYAQASQLPSVATSSAVGLVKPDGSSITVDANGVLTAVGGGGSSDPYDGRKTRYTISASSWSSSPNSDGYYTYSLTLTNPLTTSTSPNVYIAGASDSTQPTATESTMFSYVKRCNLSSSTTLVLYADTKPTNTFYVFVGAEGGGINFGSPFVNKKFSYADLQSGSGTATKELSSTEISALLACNSVLIVLRQNDENDNSVDQQVGTTILLTNRIKTPIADVISFINYEHNSTTAPLPVQGFYRYNHYGTNNTHVLTFKASQAYMDDQWSSGKWWYITMYKLS